MEKPDKGTCATGDEAYGEKTAFGNLPLAMVYAPEQKWGHIFTPEDGLARGTLFEGLYLPLKGEESV